MNQSKIGSNLVNSGNLMSKKEELYAKMAQAASYAESKGLAGCVDQQGPPMSEVDRAFTELLRHLDNLECSLSGLTNRLDPVLQLDRPQSNQVGETTAAPPYAASKVGQGIIAAAHRVSDACSRVNAIIEILAV